MPTPGHDLSVAPGQKFTLSGIGSGDADGEITSWRWDVHGTGQTLEGPTPELSFAEPGIYPITLTVTDDSSAGNRTAQSNVTISVNHQPVAEAGNDIFNDTLRVILDASASADADNDGLSYRWDFGDGTFGEGAMAEHTYANGGIYPVVLTVDDGRGLSNSKDSDAISVRVNRPPVAVAGGNKQACIGDVVVFDGSSSTDPDNGLLRYAWNFGDGEKATIVNPTKTYADPGTYKLRLQVTDELGLSNATSVDESLITILPAPVAHAGDDMQVCANTSVRFDGTKSIDLDGVVNRFSWDFGDGQAGGGDQPEHTYLDPGTYRATSQIEGDNLGICSPVSSDELIVTVIDSPKAAIKAPAAAATAEEIAFDGTGSTIGNKTALNFAWDFGDGTTGTGAVARHAFAEPGVYRVQFRRQPRPRPAAAPAPRRSTSSPSTRRPSPIPATTARSRLGARCCSRARLPAIPTGASRNIIGISPTVRLPKALKCVISGERPGRITSLSLSTTAPAFRTRPARRLSLSTCSTFPMSRSHRSRSHASPGRWNSNL